MAPWSSDLIEGDELAKSQKATMMESAKIQEQTAILIMSLLFGRYTHIWQGMSYADITGLPYVARLHADFIYASFGS